MVAGVAVGHEIVRALSFAGGMTWEILWALILGFALSGAVQAVVSKREMRRLMPDDSPRTLLVSTGLGAASSSCSYASVALARSLFRRGADFTAAMVFEFASTNLVFELGIVMALLLGWQFVAGEFVGGPLMIVLLVVLFRVFLTRQLVDQARAEVAKGRLGSMEGHAEMDMSADAKGSWWHRLRTAQGFTATADYFVMDWAAIWRDIAAGLLIAGALAAWVPHSFWQGLFLAHHPTLTKLWGPLIAPLVAIISFVCSVGNVPLAAVLWNGGISLLRVGGQVEAGRGIRRRCDDRRLLRGFEPLAREPPYNLVALHRYPLGTNYTRIVDDITNRLLTPPLARRSMASIDQTGVGSPVIDLFKQDRRVGDIYGITISGGTAVGGRGYQLTVLWVPKTRSSPAAPPRVVIERPTATPAIAMA